MKILAAILFSLVSLSSFAIPNGVAPAFELKAASGKTVKLSDYKGKTIVLEWLNHGCPFVRKHYDTNNMQMLQQKYTSKGVVWLSIISSAEGKQGYVNEAGGRLIINPILKKKVSKVHRIILPPLSMRS